MADMNNKQQPQQPQQQQPASPRQRLQQLLSVPERDRTDEQWDEINELEIMLASGNRNVEAAHAGRGTPLARQQQKPSQGQDPRKQGRKFHKRPKRKGP